MKKLAPYLPAVFAAVLVSGFLATAYAAGSDSVGSGSAMTTTGSAAGSATTATPDAPPDVLGHPAETLSTMSKLYHSGAFFQLSILVAFAIAMVLDKKTPWLKAGKARVYFAAALGGLTLLAIPASQGATPNLAMLVGVGTTMIALIINPKKPQDPTGDAGTGTTTNT